MYDPQFITPVHLDWATQNRVVITDGECGFGRTCVGLSAGSYWIDWRANTGSPDYTEIPCAYDGWVPDNAYHKHDCVAVLGDDSGAWNELALWLDAIMEGGWEVIHSDRVPKDSIDLLFHGTTTARLGKPKEIPVNS